MDIEQMKKELAELRAYKEAAEKQEDLRYTSDGALAECPCCGSLDVGGAHDKVFCHNCGISVTRPRPLQNAIDAWNTRTRIAKPVPADKPKSKHKDDIAVDRFADAMKVKLAKARAKGRSGWDTCACDDRRLAAMLMEHTLKGNDGSFEDVANFAMMLHQRGADPKVLADAAKGNRFTPAEREAVERALDDKPAVAVPGVFEAIYRMAQEFKEAWPEHTGKYHWMIGCAEEFRRTPSHSQQSAQFNQQELNIIRQWHNCVEDCNPKYLQADGFDDNSVYQKVLAMLDRCPSHESEQGGEV